MSSNIYICSTLSPFEKNIKAIGYTTYYWEPGSTLRIHFLNGDEQWKRKVAGIADEWTQYANLDFQFYYDPNHPPVDQMGNNIADIAIDFWENNYGGGWSYYDTDSRREARKGNASMMLPTWDAQGTIWNKILNGRFTQTPAVGIYLSIADNKGASIGCTLLVKNSKV